MERSYDDLMDLIGKAIVVSSENSQSTAVILTRLEAQDRLLGGLANTVSNISGDVVRIEDEIMQLKQNEEITTEQSTTLRLCAEKRICEILGPDPLDRKKYYKIFAQKLYNDTRKIAGMGSKIDRTRKGNYQRCVDYIESWIPSCGCAELRTRADANAKARLEAKRNGYL